jgi:hypothetical protein
MTARANMPATAARLSPSRAELAPGVVWNGNADLIPLLKPLADCVPDAENAKIHPEHNLAGIRESLGLLSQYRPLVGWRPTPGSKIVVLAGNGTFESIRAIGWTHAAVTVYEGKPHAARTLALIDNKTAETSTWNEELASRQMQEVMSVWAEEAAAPVEEVVAPVPEQAPAPRPESHAQSKPDPRPRPAPAPTGPLTFARALALKIAEIPPGPHRVGLIDSAVRRLIERAAEAASMGGHEFGSAAAKRVRALADEIVNKETA